MDTAAVTARLKKFEGEIPYLYRCTGGEVTIGIGHAILSEDLAAQLDWSIKPIDPTTEWRKVAAAEKGHPATFYEPLTACRMTDAAIQALLATDIPIYSSQLDHVAPGWQKYPENAQQALFDMVYNLGAGGLSKYPKMLAAAAAGDWSTAAAESHRNGIPDARNQEIRDLFQSCAD
jgi:GH24 family phage-related lysozyme (muramidase)